MNASADADFVSGADAACAAADTKLRHVANTTSAQSQSQAFWAELSAIAREKEARLASLSPPAAEQGQYAKLLNLEQQEYLQIPEAERKSKEDTAPHLESQEAEERIPDERAKAYEALGLAVCLVPTG